MQMVTILALVGAAYASVPLVGRVSSNMVLGGLEERQTICKLVPEPATCESSCGPGYITCIEFPNCYNPGDGESCCSNGKYCPAGYYCSDTGCCPDGSSLEECGATATLSVIAPPEESTGASEPSSAEETMSEEPTFAPKPTTTTERTSEEPTSAPAETIEASTTSLPATTSFAAPTAESNSTTPITPVPTAGAAQAVEYVMMAVLGALGVAFFGIV